MVLQTNFDRDFKIMQIKTELTAIAIPYHSSPQIDLKNKIDGTLDVFSLLLFCPIIILIIAIYNYISKTIQLSFYPKSEYKFPCYHCQYFNSNHYIKCAVNPEIVLTDRAVNCRDCHLAAKRIFDK